MTMNARRNGKPRLGVSSCLLGESVRYDGRHRLDPFLVGTLGEFVECIAVCPEVECGLPTPRDAMRLVGDPGSPRLVTVETGVDHTDQMGAWIARRLAELERENLDGFIFKSGSPSCGMRCVDVHDETGAPIRNGAGLWARAFMKRFPLLPVEDETRLHNPQLRDNFVERIFCLRRYRIFRKRDGTPAGLAAFHADHKLLFMSHSPEMLAELGRLVADAGDHDADELLANYEPIMMDCLRARTSIVRHTNVLEHMMGYLRAALAADERLQLQEAIGNFRDEFVPLVVPITLLAHYVRKYDEPYLRTQVYLHPHPMELKLRNHA